MPKMEWHLRFDDYLKNHNVIYDDSYGETVHRRMDRGLIKFGRNHRDIDFYHSEEGIRDWLRGMNHISRQETLTDYLRIALGHLVLDDIQNRRSEFSFNSVEDMIKTAYRSYSQRGYQRKFFRY